MGGVCSSPTATLVTSEKDGQNGRQKPHWFTRLSNNDKKKAPVQDGQLLTAKQLKLVQNTWDKLDDDLTSRGTKVFLKIFALAPETKGLFNFRYIPDSELMANHLFKAHGTRFMQVVSAVIENINDLDTQLSPTLHNLGKVHVVKYGVSMEFFDLFKTAMMMVWEKDLGSNFTPQAREAWGVVFDYILNEMKVGFCSANQNHTKSFCSNSTTETITSDKPVHDYNIHSKQAERSPYNKAYKESNHDKQPSKEENTNDSASHHPADNSTS